MPLTYTLVRECLNNVEDVAGRWQIEGGHVLQAKRKVANYSSVKRISCGTQEQNTAMLWLTLFFLKGGAAAKYDAPRRPRFQQRRGDRQRQRCLVNLRIAHRQAVQESRQHADDRLAAPGAELKCM